MGCDAPPAAAANLVKGGSFDSPPPPAEPGAVAFPNMADDASSGWSAASYGAPKAAAGGTGGHDDPRVRFQSDTAVSFDGRHSLRIIVPTAAPLVFSLPGQQLVKDGHPGWCELDSGCTGAKVGDIVIGSSMTLPGGRSYAVSFQAQATPCGAVVEVMHGGWNVTSAGKVRNVEDDVRAVYAGTPLNGAAPPVKLRCGNKWTRVAFNFTLPPPSAASNGTSLQLRITPPASAAGWGATVWLDQVSVTPR